MANEKDLYAVLGVSRKATVDEIKKAYRKLARKHHPDLNPGNKQAEERFKEISVAQDVLTDPEKRKVYDEFGLAGLQAGFDPNQAREYQRWAGGGGRGTTFRTTGEGGFDFRDFESTARRRGGARAQERSFTDIIEELFGRASMGQESSEAPAAGGGDIEYPIEVDFLDALRGIQTSVSVRRPVPCPQCHGTGRQGLRACQRCTGTGTIEEREVLKVKIPPGIADGARVRVRGKGGVGLDGAPGDLYFLVKIRPHPLIQRDGNDLTIEVPVTVGEAMLGATIDVPTPPKGRVQMKVPPKSQSGQRLRLKGRGVVDPKTKAAGDIYVRLVVHVPKDGTSERVREAVEVLEEAYPENPRAHLKL
jgi:DnaJ-class molecular chaperone